MIGSPQKQEQAVTVDALLSGRNIPSVPNKMERDFHADKPNQKWITNITEFARPAGKVYLSALMDCFNGMIPSWTISTTPDSMLVNTMLDQTIAQLPEGEWPLIPSYRTAISNGPAG